ncbi:nucleoside diphosphate kinase [Ligilactobacillus sp. WC1T17]|uniref:nucleoside-diphosphate kinase n=1 Tax=Ligilactobacillus ruminis TaxID=1623 RepID=A0ABY1AES9_9LACO|nr:nucleoside diphosphate kinase [Ligilactobacillus ruminis]
MTERTLVLIKPDGYLNHHIGHIITRIEEKGFKLVDMKMVQATDDMLKEHYNQLVGKPYFPGIVSYMESAPIVAMVVEGLGVVDEMHRMAGDTYPTKAAFGTIRGDYAIKTEGAIQNVVHTSDSVESAEREIAIWF